MGLEGRYSKRMQFHRETANAFSSCRRLMNGVDGDTEDLQQQFLHDAKTAAFESSPFISDLKKYFSTNRKNGCVCVKVPISKQDWYEFQDIIDIIQNINEESLSQFCLEYYLDGKKKKGIE